MARQRSRNETISAKTAMVDARVQPAYAHCASPTPHIEGSNVGFGNIRELPYESRKWRPTWSRDACVSTRTVRYAASQCGAQPLLRAFHVANSNGHLQVNVEQEVIKTLRVVLGLGDEANRLDANTPLLGSVAELDSMAVVSILTALEERFGFVVDDDEVEGRTFASVGSLTQFVQDKLAQ